MKHLTNLVVVISLSLCLGFSIANVKNATAQSVSAPNQPSIRPVILTGKSHVMFTGLNSAPNGEWQVLLSEGFEGPWPYSGWAVVDLSNDGYDRKWSVDEYRPHSPGLKAAWPARGGRNGRDPTAKNNDYFDDMDTRMVYGPFDLSDAGSLEINFWLWWQTEANQDYLILEASRNNVIFDELGRWHGTSSGWQLISISTDDYALDGSVWVSWRFTSNASNVFDGPWVDEITVKKLEFGYVTVYGFLYYSDRFGNNALSPYTTIALRDEDFDGHNELWGTTTTDEFGYFQFSPILNYDYDGNNYPLDLYITAEAEYNDTVSSQHRVTYFNGNTYEWRFATSWDITDGWHDLTQYIPAYATTVPAMWIFQDIRNAWGYIYNNTNPPSDAGSITARYQVGATCYPNFPWICGSFFYGGIGVEPYIFISEENIVSPDAIIHESSHNTMYNENGWWWWDPLCWGHMMFSEVDTNCAWSEGWADYLPLIVNNDQCYDWGKGPCGADGWQYYDLETIDRNYYPPAYKWGDWVEGRVAGSLYDLFDSVNEGYDSSTFGFAPIAEIVFNGTNVVDFPWFWINWLTSGLDKHNAVRSIYQNTIDYDGAPIFYPELPDKTIFENDSPWHNAIDLWEYSFDNESMDYELIFEITNNPDPGCGIDLENNRWIEIAPQPNWLGTCDVTIRVSDSIKSTSDTFNVNVIAVADTKYIPIIYVMFNN